MILAHQVKFAQDIGYSSTFAASILALFGIIMAIGQPSSMISDWIGREKTVIFAIILAIGAMVALISVEDTSQPWLWYVYAICFGYGTGLYATLTYVGAADIFYGRQFGTISGLMLTGLGVGGVIGPWLGGYIYDVSGSYTGAFILCMVCFGLAGGAYWIAAPRKAVEIRARALS
jgi:MFS family permease